MSTTQRTCKHCHKQLTKNALYCDRTCMGLSYRNSVSLVCETCGETFDVKPAHQARYNARFCSIRCKAIGTRTGDRSTCVFCHKPFYVRPSRIERHAAGKYCSRACRDAHWREAPEANSHWKGGRSPMKYRGRAVQWRNTVLLRDREVCQDCGVIDPGNHAHHIYPWRDWPSVRYSVSNGRTLCQTCHGTTYGREAEYAMHLGLPPSPPAEWLED